LNQEPEVQNTRRKVQKALEILHAMKGTGSLSTPLTRNELIERRNDPVKQKEIKETKRILEERKIRRRRKIKSRTRSSKTEKNATR